MRHGDHGDHGLIIIVILSVYFVGIMPLKIPGSANANPSEPVRC